MTRCDSSGLKERLRALDLDCAQFVRVETEQLQAVGRDELRLVLDTNASRKAEAKLGPTKVSFSDGCRSRQVKDC
jgi:hypothetical protein